MAERPSRDGNLRRHFTTAAVGALIIVVGVFHASCTQTARPSSSSLTPPGPTLRASAGAGDPVASPTRSPGAASPVPAISPTLPLPSPSPQASPTAAVSICQPLAEIAPADLKAAVSNPFNPPPLGSDDPHHGVDFAIQQGGIALTGGRVQAVLPGVVAAILQDRFPYGNAVFVETLPQDLPPELRYLLDPQADSTPQVHSPLTCPQVEGAALPEDGPRSLYLLYAHLQEVEVLAVGDAIGCGVPLGTLGQSGNALNPHLHLEARAGPAGVRFGGLAHYVTDATPLEMHNYCLWRVSGKFRLIDPLLMWVDP